VRREHVVRGWGTLLGMKGTGSAPAEGGLEAQLALVRNCLRASFEEAPAAMALLHGPDHRFVFANRAYLKMARKRRNEILERTVKEALPELLPQGFLDLLNRVYQTGQTVVAAASQVNLVRRGEQVTLYVDFTYHPICNLHGQVEGILFQGVDVTEQVLTRTRLEERVSERTRELMGAEETLRALNHRLVRAQEEERRRIALELHDSVGQSIAALHWKLASLEESAKDAGGVIAKDLAVCRGLAENVAQEIRIISHLLYPPALDEAGLSPALEVFIEGVTERSGLVVHFEVDSDLGRLPKDLEMAAFRIVQEALTNIHRHARTNEAFVRVRRDPASLSVEIEDHGRGIAKFTSIDHLRRGLGMIGMRERARHLSGVFDVLSSAAGTAVKATLPIADAP
jgi:PAS domain S-box-containing protein